MNKSLISNIITIIIIALGLLLDNTIVLSVGLFALSGALTNTIAIHMLFEKVPFLYGSGVIEDRFEQFKLTIENLIMNQFFTKDNLQKFFKDEFGSDNSHIDLNGVIDKTDFTPAFVSLKDAVMESSFGGMLGMFGGVSALEPLQEPFTLKMKAAIGKIVHTDTFQATLQESLSSSDISDDIYEKLNNVVKQRLDELTPKLTKEIIQEMIKEHLGWLVVWGAVFGGLIGLVGAIIL
jgi:uncharacterized membrane protein YheB (UPF0754 family)